MDPRGGEESPGDSGGVEMNEEELRLTITQGSGTPDSEKVTPKR